MSVDELTAFIPIAIEPVGRRTVVRWIERPRTASPLPFFSQVARELVVSGARQRVTPIEALLATEGRGPAGIVLHVSRCGSTLVMQSLAAAECVASVSEPTPVSQLLLRGNIPDADRVLMLSGLMRALVPQVGAAVDVPTLVKLTSWNVLFLDVIRAALPDTPWVFLYRDPLEVMASHAHRTPRWLSDDAFLTTFARLHRAPHPSGLSGAQRSAMMWGAFGAAALRENPGPTSLLDYDQLPNALSADVPARFRIRAGEAQRARIVEASRFYSKGSARATIFDRGAERLARPVSQAMREADAQYSRAVYAELDVRRGGVATASG
ncbi:MAG: hypothetical protein ABI601_18100 [bacterium]